MMGMSMVVYRSGQDGGPANPIRLLILLSGLIGVSMSTFWPFLMGWLSTGHEGKKLNRRLGLFNIAWSSGSLISPLLGGYLVERSSLLPMLAGTTSLILCLISVSRAKVNRENDLPEAESVDNRASSDLAVEEKDLLAFRWIARIATTANSNSFHAAITPRPARSSPVWITSWPKRQPDCRIIGISRRSNSTFESAESIIVLNK